MAEDSFLTVLLSVEIVRHADINELRTVVSFSLALTYIEIVVPRNTDKQNTDANTLLNNVY